VLPSILTVTPWGIGIGFYTVPEAARLLKIPPVNIRRWLGGYTYRKKGETIDLPPLWRPQLPSSEHHIELGFRDLIELWVDFEQRIIGIEIARGSNNGGRKIFGS